MLIVSQNGNNDCFLLRGKSDMYTKLLSVFKGRISPSEKIIWVGKPKLISAIFSMIFSEFTFFVVFYVGANVMSVPDARNMRFYMYSYSEIQKIAPMFLFCLILMSVWILLFLLVIYHAYKMTYAITDKYFYCRDGTSIEEFSLTECEDVTFRRGVIDKIFGVGCIYLHVKHRRLEGRQRPKEILYIPDFKVVSFQIQHAVDNAKKRKKEEIRCKYRKSA